MKIYGYRKRDAGHPGLLEMKEIHFAANVQELEQVISFLQKAVDEKRSHHLRASDHLHISDVIDGWDSSKIDIIVS